MLGPGGGVGFLVHRGMFGEEETLVWITRGMVSVLGFSVEFIGWGKVGWLWIREHIKQWPSTALEKPQILYANNQDSLVYS